MKKCAAILLILALLCASTAMAEIGAALRVVNCQQYITLREEPSASSAPLTRIPLYGEVSFIEDAGNGFYRVSYRGMAGYAMSRYLRLEQSYSGTALDPSSKQRYNLNLFLSNFTEQGFMLYEGSFDARWSDNDALTDFAIDHCWFNRQNRLEWGEYFAGNNVRMKDKQISDIVKKYFGFGITPSRGTDRFDYRDHYYYWEETGGHTSDGFACLTRVEKLGGGRYSVWFNIYGGGEHWENNVCYNLPEQSEYEYPSYGSVPFGHAVIDASASGLNSDRSGWKLERYTVTCD